MIQGEKTLGLEVLRSMVGGWSRPSGLHGTVVVRWASASEVPQRLKPSQNRTLKCSTKVLLHPESRSNQIKTQPDHTQPDQIQSRQIQSDQNQIQSCEFWNRKRCSHGVKAGLLFVHGF